MASGTESEAAWEQKTPQPSSRSGLSPYIKPKKKVAALFGGQKAADEVSQS